MTKLTEQQLVASVRRGLDQSADQLDWQTHAKLTRIRLQALEQQADRPSFGINLASFSHGFATAAVVTLVKALWLLPETTDKSQPTMPQAIGIPLVDVDGKNPASHVTEADVGVMEVLMSTEDMEFLENLEMYEWLAAEYS